MRQTTANSLEEYVDEIDAAMQDSIKAHKVADVEVGSFLSSGVDSSYVAACFHGDKTFTVGFDYEKYNEIDYAKALSEKIKIDNYSKLISKKGILGFHPYRAVSHGRAFGRCLCHCTLFCHKNRIGAGKDLHERRRRR